MQELGPIAEWTYGRVFALAPAACEAQGNRSSIYPGSGIDEGVATSTTNRQSGLRCIEVAYSEVAVLSARTVGGASPLRYLGQEFDAEVGLSAINLRQYVARLDRWQTLGP